MGASVFLRSVPMGGIASVGPVESGPYPIEKETVVSTPETVEAGAELEVRDAATFLDLADRFSQERKQQIAQFLDVPEDSPAFLPFLAISYELGLNPILGEIWLIPQAIREKQGGSWVTVGHKYRPSVGRDGLLRKAREDPSFEGIKSDVVCANDEFEVEHDTSNPYAPPKIIHRYGKKEAGKDPRRSRGAVIGAWAILYLRNRPPVYFFADAAEYAKTKTRDGKKEYSGAWEYTSAMCLKAAVSYVCRTGLGVSGVLPADEMRLPTLEQVKQGALMPAPEEDDAPGEADFWDGIRDELGGDDALTMRLKAIFEGRPLAEAEMTLSGLTPESLAAYADEHEDAPEEVTGEVEPLPEPDVIALRERLEELKRVLAEDDPIEEHAADLRAEIDQIEGELAEIAGADPAQEALL